MKAQGLRLRSMCEQCEGVPRRAYADLQPKEVLFVEGSAAEHLFPVVAGFLKESRILPDGRSVTLRLIAPGDVLGTEALVRSDYGSTVEAISAARLCIVQRTRVHDTLFDDLDQTLAFHRLLEMHVQAMRDQLILTNGLSADERVLEALRHLGRAFAPGAWFKPALNRKELSEYLDLAIATVSRSIGRLKERKLIEVKGREIRITQR